jgi:large conductance mechanosensitive channel
MWKEFKEFALKGNVLDLAVAVILGTAFGAIVKSLVDDIIMPLFGVLTGGVNFSDLFIALDDKSYPSLAVAKAAGAATINYGVFINTIITFLIVALALFMVIKAYNTAVKVKPAEVDRKDCPYCMSSIPIKATRCPQCTSELQVVA